MSHGQSRLEAPLSSVARMSVGLWGLSARPPVEWSADRCEEQPSTFD